MIIELNLFRRTAPGSDAVAHFIHIPSEDLPLQSFSSPSLIAAARAARAEATFAGRDAFVRVTCGTLADGEISYTATPDALVIIALLLVAFRALLALCRLASTARLTMTERGGDPHADTRFRLLESATDDADRN